MDSFICHKADISSLITPLNTDTGIGHFSVSQATNFHIALTPLYRDFLLRTAYNTEFTQQDGKTLVCDKHDTAITYVFCRDLLLIPMFSGPLQKDLFKGK